jgi:hypothetical protein
MARNPPNLDVLAKMLDTFVIVIVTWPFGTVDGHLSRPLHGACGLLGEVVDAVDVLLADAPALATVVVVGTQQRRREAKEDEPVAGGETQLFEREQGTDSVESCGAGGRGGRHCLLGRWGRSVHPSVAGWQAERKKSGSEQLLNL